MRITSGRNSASARWFPGARHNSARSGSTSGSASRRSNNDSVGSRLGSEHWDHCSASLTAMSRTLSAVQLATSREERSATTSQHADVAPHTLSQLATRVYGEYREMPGLILTVRQAARLFGVTPVLADAVLLELQRASVLARTNEGAFALIDTPSRERTAMPTVRDGTG